MSLTSHAPIWKDVLIDQDWPKYSAADHARWDYLYHRQRTSLANRAAPAFLDGLERLKLSHSGIPDFKLLNQSLQALTGWQIVSVPGLIEDHIFFALLADRLFPAGTFMRNDQQLDYIQEPDIFHDVFGHVPLLSDPVFADYMQAYGQGGVRAQNLGVLPLLSRLYWYSVEFGLLKTSTGLKIYGAGIVSSARESAFCIEDPSPHHLDFDISRILQTNYRIDDFQQCYFAIESFKQLLHATQQDLLPLYQRLKHAPPLGPEQLRPEESALRIGTQHYFTTKHLKKD